MENDKNLVTVPIFFYSEDTFRGYVLPSAIVFLRVICRNYNENGRVINILEIFARKIWIRNGETIQWYIYSNNKNNKL